MVKKDTTLSIEDKFDEVRQLIIVGKEKGYLLYDEVSDLLPADLTASPEDLEELFAAFGAAGIDLVDSEKSYRERDGMEREEGEGPELDLTPGALDKTNDPVRMYLREMGTVPLLTREGEVAIAKRIEQGKLSVIKSISRMPAITKAVIRMGDALRAGDRTIRELVIFNDEEITDDRIEERAQQFLKQVEAVRKARLAVEKFDEKLELVPRKDKRKYRRARWKVMRAQVETSKLIRKIEFTEIVKRKLIDEVKDIVDDVLQGAARARIGQQDADREEPPAEAEGRGAQELPQAAEGPARRDQAAHRRSRGEPGAPAPHARDDLHRRGEGRAGEEGAGRSQPPPRRLDRQEVHEPRPAVPRPDSGRQHRPDEGRRQVRIPPRLQVLDLRDVVDPPGDHARHCRPGADDPHPGPHDRDDQQADSHVARAGAGARAASRPRKRSRGGWTSRSPRSARS